ncbi:CAP domain-containing protein [Robertkochia marina]|uniref:CAP domain-containing protein n=1 Tax=Robertkochia marina TaxID=1227945 RepID=A0A4S3LZQ7_9FLAO|nr:CAP domain-containing protein [Robertkochia marina]THD66661.1 CAP domain-containing protein [Robertkochia marina]TRZ45500.1 CAP domain-containing protein [Robertkochia marina]
MKALTPKGAVLLCLYVMMGCTLISCSHDLEEDLHQAQALTLINVEAEVFDLINAHRVEIGLNPLSDLDIAYPKAAEHTEYMVLTGEASHHNFYDREAYLISQAGAEDVAENVAKAYGTAEGAVNAWLGSEAHKAVIEGAFTHGSICVMKDEHGKYFYTHIFVKK